MSLVISLTDEERMLADSYSRLHSISVADAFKKALFEKIEYEYDITIADEACAEYIAGGKKSKPIENLWEELGL